MLLSVSDLAVQRGSLRVLDDASFEVDAGQIVALTGDNGAGKSTLLTALVGLLAPVRGAIRLNGRRIEGAQPKKIASLGMVLVPQGRRVFPALTVRQNLVLGAYVRWSTADVEAEVEGFMERYPILARRADQPAGALSGGEQALLVIGRALLARPSVILLDEPLMGLAGGATKLVLDHLEQEAADGTAVMVVEHNRAAIASIASHGLAVRDGRLFHVDNGG